MIITRNISVLNQGISADIDIVYGTDLVLIEFYITDCVLPNNAIATVYCTTSKKELVKSIGKIENNTISFEPKAGFFTVGRNNLQIRITSDEKNLYSFEVNVNCKGNMASDDAKEVEKQPSLVTQLLTKVGNLFKAIADEATERKAADSAEERARKQADAAEKAERQQADAKEKTERQAEIAVERQRINQFMALSDGSTTGDAELQDIRIDIEGSVHDSAGVATRTQLKKIADQFAGLSIMSDNLFNANEYHVAGCINYDGSITASSGTGSILYKVFISAGDYVSNMATNNVYKIACYNSANKFIGFGEIIETISDNLERFTILEGTSYAYMSYWDGRVSTDTINSFDNGMIVKGDTLPDEYVKYYKTFSSKYKINKENVEENADFTPFVNVSEDVKKGIAETLVFAGTNKINTSVYKRGTVAIGTGEFVEQTDETSNIVYEVDVIQNKQYSINAKPMQNISAWNKDGSYYGALFYDASGESNEDDYCTFTIPATVNKIMVSFWYGRLTDLNKTITQLQNITMIEGDRPTAQRIGIPHAEALKDLKINRSNFDMIEFNERLSKGLKWCIMGDSRSVDTAYTTKFYHDYIAERHPMLRRKNVAVSGARIRNAFNGNPSLQDQISSVPMNTELLTIYAGINDYGQDSPTELGAFDPDSIDTATFYGAMNVLIKSLIERIPSAKIIVFTPIPQFDFTISGTVVWGDRNVQNALNLSLDDYVNAIKEVCGWYGVKCYDSCNMAGITPRVNAQRTLYFTDGLHHNENGHLELSYYIEQAIIQTL